MRSLVLAVLITVAAPAIAATDPPEKPREGPGGIGGVIGHGINFTLGEIPVIGGMVDGLHNGARRAVNNVRGRGARKEAERQAQMLWQLCITNPTAHAQACAQRFPTFRDFFLPQAGSGAADGASALSPPGAAPPSLKPPGSVSGELVARVQQHQGHRSREYRDTSGARHTGYGHNLDSNRILVADLRKAEREAERVVGDDCWGGLSEERRDVLIEMAFDNGELGLSRYDDMLPALCAGDYMLAAVEMADSEWALDHGGRAVLLQEIMRTGDGAQ